MNAGHPGMGRLPSRLHYEADESNPQARPGIVGKKGVLQVIFFLGKNDDGPME
jgi:hypothetical protein